MMSKETPQKDAMFALKMEEEKNLDMNVRDAMLDYVGLSYHTKRNFLTFFSKYGVVFAII